MILVYKGNDEKILKQLDRLQMEYKVVGDEQLSEKMRDLLTMNVEGKIFTHNTFLYLDGLNEEQMKKIDECIHVGRIAVSTQSNLEWTLSHLMNEVDKEYHYFEIRNDLYQMLIHPDKERIKTDPDYLHLLSYGYSLYENEKTPVKQLEQVLHKIRGYL